MKEEKKSLNNVRNKLDLNSNNDINPFISSRAFNCILNQTSHNINKEGKNNNKIEIKEKVIKKEKKLNFV